MVDEVGAYPPPSAAHSLESYVSRLRRALSPTGSPSSDAGAATGSTSVGPFSTPQVFEDLVDQAAQALADGDHPRAASIAKEALGLWHVLADVTLHLESGAEAERLDELRSRAFEIRVEADLALGRHAELVAKLRRLVEETPYRERLVAQLMVALYRAGRHVEALEVYADPCRTWKTISASGRARSFRASRRRLSARSLTFGRPPSRCRPVTVSQRG